MMCTNLLLAVALEVLLRNASKPFISQPLCRKHISLIVCTWPAANYICMPVKSLKFTTEIHLYEHICGYSLGISRYCVVAQRQILLCFPARQVINAILTPNRSASYVDQPARSEN